MNKKWLKRIQITSMATIIKSYQQLESIVNDKIRIAVENVSRHLTEELKSYIQEDFYRRYQPKFYERTYRFLNSPKYDILSNTSAKIFVDTDIMHYLCGEQGITGEDIAWLASKGYHGTTDIFREGYFWEDFLAYANSNVHHLLKTELRKQGLQVK